MVATGHSIGPGQFLAAIGWGRASARGSLSVTLQVSRDLELTGTATPTGVPPITSPVEPPPSKGPVSADASLMAASKGTKDQIPPGNLDSHLISLPSTIIDLKRLTEELTTFRRTKNGARSLENASTTLDDDGQGEGPPAIFLSLISCFAEEPASENDEGSARTHEVSESRALFNDSRVPIHDSAATVVSSTGEERQIAVIEDAEKQSEVELGAFEEEYPAVQNIIELDATERQSSSLAMGEPGETKMKKAVLGAVVELEGQEHGIQLTDITNIGSRLPNDESIEQDGKLAAGRADPTRFTLKRKVEGGGITRPDGARINATILHVEKGGLPHRIATIQHDGKDYCVDVVLLETLDGSIPLSKIIEEHGHLAGDELFDLIDRGDKENVNGEDILEATAGDGKVQEMAIEGEDDCVDFDSLERLSPEMPLDILFEKQGHLAAMEGQGQVAKVILIGRPVIWSFYGKIKYTLVEIPEKGETDVTILRKAVVKHQGQSYLVDKDTFEYMIRGESPSQIIKKHGEVPRDASPQAPSGSSPVEVRYIKDVAGNGLKHLITQENGTDKSGKYVAIVEHGGQRYGFDLDSFENAIGSLPIAQLVAKNSRGSDVQATEVVSKQTIQTHDGRSEHPLSEIFSEHGDVSSKGLIVQDEGGVDRKTVFTTVSLAGPSGEREMGVVKHTGKTCYVPLHIMEQYRYPKQLATKAIVSKHGMFVPNPEQEVRWMIKCVVANGAEGKVAYIIVESGKEAPGGDGLKGGIRWQQVSTVPFNGKQYEIELGTFQSLIRQQPVLFLIGEYGKLVQEISPHLDPTKLLYLVKECLDEDGVNRVEKVVISTGKDDHELGLEKLDTLVSHMPLEETASKHGAVRAKSQRDLTLNTTREVDKGEKTLTSPSGRDINVIVKERVFEEASQETGKIKRRMRGRQLEFENASGVKYEVRLDVLEERLATMEIDAISRQFGIATLRKSQHSQEEGGDVQEGEDVEPVLEPRTVKGVSGKEMTFLAEKSTGRLGGGEEKQVASVGFEGALREVDLNVFKGLAPKKRAVHDIVLQFGRAKTFLSGIDGQQEEGSFGVELQGCQDEQGKRQETVATVKFEINKHGVELQTLEISDSMPPEGTIEKYGKLCGRTGQRTREIAPANHHSTAAGSSSVSAAKAATVIVKSKKKAKKANKENQRNWNTRGKEDAALDIVGLNFSHGGHEQYFEAMFEKFGKVRTRANHVIQQLCGSDTYENDFCHTGSKTLLADGTISIRVLDARQGKDLKVLRESKNCKLPGVEIDIPLLTETDFQRFVCKHFVDFGAAPFFRAKEEMQVVRKFSEAGGENKKISSKIEIAEGLKNCDEIPQDGVMAARDDLGTKIPKLQKVPPPQTKKMATNTHKPVARDDLGTKIPKLQKVPPPQTKKMATNTDKPVARDDLGTKIPRLQKVPPPQTKKMATNTNKPVARDDLGTKIPRLQKVPPPQTKKMATNTNKPVARDDLETKIPRLQKVPPPQTKKMATNTDKPVARDDLGTKIPKLQKVPPRQTKKMATKTEKLVICGAVEKASHTLSPLRFERRIPPPPRSKPRARLATGGEEEMCNLHKLQLFLELNDQVWEDEEGVERLERRVAKRNLCLALKEELREEGFQ
ncbi:hypothetical protein BSKO_04753 [Bryopsis sp. KO-2023]|nr:hypothetical protein BSKO_04753 [Bryopsis sp. KO-2023]